MKRDFETPPAYGFVPDQPAVDEPKVRDRLLRAATELFARKGYSATSVSEIVAAAGVTKPILYYYFKHKEGLYLEILHEAYGQMNVVVEKGLARKGSAFERLRLLLVELLDLLIEKTEEARMIYAVYYGAPQGAPAFDFDTHWFKYLAVLQRIIEDGIQAGEIRGGSAEEIMLVVAGIMNISMEMRLSRKEALELDRDRMERLLRILFIGIATDKVRQEELLS
jgi:TetR/AcrR family transcriptional regulator